MSRASKAKAFAASATPEQKQEWLERAREGRKVARERKQVDKLVAERLASHRIEQGHDNAPSADELRQLPLHEAYRLLGLRPLDHKRASYAAVPNLCLPKLGIDCGDQAIVIEYLRREFFNKERRQRNYGFASSATIAENIGIDAEAVLRRISRMERMGYCRKIVRTKGGKNTSFALDWSGLFYAQRAIEREQRERAEDEATFEEHGMPDFGEDEDDLAPDGDRVCHPIGIGYSTPSASGAGTPSGSGMAPDGDPKEVSEGEATDLEVSDLEVSDANLSLAKLATARSQNLKDSGKKEKSPPSPNSAAPLPPHE